MPFSIRVLRTRQIIECHPMIIHAHIIQLFQNVRPCRMVLSEKILPIVIPTRSVDGVMSVSRENDPVVGGIDIEIRGEEILKL